MLMVGFFFFLSGCATITPVDINISALPKADEKKPSFLEEKMGEAGYYYLVLNYKLVDDVQLINRLSKLGARLTLYTERPKIHYQYFVIDSKYHNAFSMPNGYIVFTKTMIDALETDENIQAVMAHEIAHVTHKHVVMLYEKQNGVSQLSNIFGERLLSVISNIGYQKAFEFQADQSALRYLVRAGLKPELLIAVLEKTKEWEKEDRKAYEQDLAQKKKSATQRKLDKILMMSQPYLENRIVNCRRCLGTVKETESIQFNPDDFVF